MRHMAQKRRWPALIIPPVKIARTCADKHCNQLLEQEAE